MKHNVVAATAISFIVLSVTHDVLGESNTDQSRLPAEQARQKGIAAFENGNYIEAADAFNKAYRLKPTWKLLFNIGQSNAAGKRYGLALEAFERYLVEAGDEAPPERAEEVRQEIVKLKSKIGYLTITAQRGTVIHVNNVKRGTSPLAGPLAVNAAKEQTIRAANSNGQNIEKRFRVPSGRTVEIDLLVEEEEASTVAKSPSVMSAPSPEPRNTTPATKGRILKIAGFVSMGVGGAMLLAGAITGGLSLSKHSKLEDKCTDNICYSDNYSEMDKMSNLASAGTGLLVAGGVAAAAGLGLVLFERFTSQGSESISMKMTPVRNGLVISGRF